MTTLLEEDLDAMDSSVVHWSTSTILTIFFASSLVAALFFGLGFTFGPSQTAKFTAGTPSSAAATSTRVSEPLVQTTSHGTDNRSATQHYLSKSSPGKVKLQPVLTTDKGQAIASATTASDSHDASLAHAANRSANTVASDNRYMIQVGAIGSRKDAQKLVSRLRQQGFRAGIYPGKRDKLLHVQLGPFASTQQAQTVRRKVMAHGYHALLKPAT